MSRPSSAQPANVATTERIKSAKQIHSARVSSSKSDKKVNRILFEYINICILFAFVINILKGLAEEIKDLKV